MKKRLHIHSDNDTWAGSENMPGIFIQSKTLNDKFDVSFSYRYSKAYKKGMGKWVLKPLCKIFHVNDLTTILHKIRKCFKPIMIFKYLALLIDILGFYVFFKRNKFDILHVNNGGYPAAVSCNAAVIAGKLAGIPKITYMINSSAFNKWWEKPITWAVKKSVTEFISASKHLRKTTDFLFEGDNWRIIPNTIKYRKPTVSKKKIREFYDIKDGETFVFGLGNLEERKGFQYLPKASKYLKDKYKLLICGDGEKKKEIITNIIKNDVSNKCALITESPFHDYDLINACDIFVLPSLKDEDFPNVLLMALMYGKGIFSTNVAGIPEIVKDSGGAYADFRYVFGQKKDSITVINCITRGVNNYKKSTKPKKKFNENYKENVVIQKYIDLWEGNKTNIWE